MARTSTRAAAGQRANAGAAAPEYSHQFDRRRAADGSFCLSETGKGKKMNWIITLIIGGIVGWLASVVVKTNAQMGMIANVLVGIVGSFLGFMAAGALGIFKKA